MSPLTISRQTDGEIYLAGQRVPAGRYRQIESGREVVLPAEDLLPGSLDGRVACYERVPFAQLVTHLTQPSFSRCSAGTKAPDCGHQAR